MLHTDVCADCGEMLQSCVCEWLPHDVDDYVADICGGDFNVAPLDEDDLPPDNEDPIGFYGEGYFNHMRGGGYEDMDPNEVW